MAIRIEIDEKPYSYLQHYSGSYTTFKGDKEELRFFEVVYETNEKDLRKRINFFPNGNKFTESEKEEILKQFNLQINGTIPGSGGEDPE